MSVAPLGEMFGRLIRADRQGRAAKTVETVGWLYLVEGIVTITRRRSSCGCFACRRSASREPAI